MPDVARTIVVCPTCSYVRLTDATDRFSCVNCRENCSLNTAAVTPVGAIRDRDEGRALLGVVRARSGVLGGCGESGTETFTLDELRTELNTDPRFETLEIPNEESREGRTDRDIVLDAAESWACPSRKAILSYTADAGLSDTTAKELFNRLQAAGNIARLRGYAPGCPIYFHVLTRSRYRNDVPPHHSSGDGHLNGDSR